MSSFHPPVFPPANPGVINIDDDTSGDGCLPPITRDGITIDTQNAGVVLDGDEDEVTVLLSPIACEAAIDVRATENGFDFAILGGKGLKIQDFDAQGIQIDGDEQNDAGDPICTVAGGGCGVGTITISGVHISNVTRNGIKIHNVASPQS
jgi:hypothetical protein